MEEFVFGFEGFDLFGFGAEGVDEIDLGLVEDDFVFGEFFTGEEGIDFFEFIFPVCVVCFVGKEL